MKIKYNTYPVDGIGKYAVGTLCNWRIEHGHLLLSVCNEDGSFKKTDGMSFENILSKGQIYALNGNLLSGQKEPDRIGEVAFFRKKGWSLIIQNK